MHGVPHLTHMGIGTAPPPKVLSEIAFSRHESTPVGFAPTLGDRVFCTATGLSHILNEKGSDSVGVGVGVEVGARAGAEQEECEREWE